SYSDSVGQISLKDWQANRQKCRQNTLTMDTPKTPLSDPSILLLNEIEILLAQSRLLELYLKQSQATAAYETARAYGWHQSELAELHAALSEKEQIDAAKKTAGGAREPHIQARVKSP